MIFEFGKRTLLESFETVGATLKARYLFAAPYAKGKRVLDLGCAAGYGSYYLLQEAKAKSVTGVDISSKAIARAKQEFQSSNLPAGEAGLKFQMADAQKLPFPHHSFDLVVSFEVIEHVPNIEKYLSEIARVAKPNSTAIISTPNKAYTSPNTKLPILPFHVREFYESEFAPTLKKHFGKVEIFHLKTVSPEYEERRQEYLEGLQFKITKTLSQIKLVRWLSLFTPQWLNDLVTGCKKVPLDSQKEKVKIAKGQKNPHGFVAVCKKPL